MIIDFTLPHEGFDIVMQGMGLHLITDQLAGNEVVSVCSWCSCWFELATFVFVTFHFDMVLLIVC